MVSPANNQKNQWKLCSFWDADFAAVAVPSSGGWASNRFDPLQHHHHLQATRYWITSVTETGVVTLQD